MYNDNFCWKLITSKFNSTLHCSLFSLFFFIVILENPAPFSLNFCSPMTYFSKERSSHIAPSPQPHPRNQKKSPENAVHFPVTIVICKHWPKFVTCSPSPRDCGGVIHSQRNSYYGFWPCGTKWLSQNFDPLTLEKKLAWEGA